MIKKNVVVSLVVIAVLIVVGWFVVDRFALFKSGLKPGQIVNQIEKSLETEGQQKQSVPYKVEEVVTGLQIPWSIVFTSKDRMLVTERPGRVRIVENGKLQSNPLRTFPEVLTTGEEGLMSLALDPDYQKNQHLYASLAYGRGDDLKVKVVRFTDNGNELVDDKIVIDNIPAAQYHAGCRIAFGPDGKLYITTGDATDKAIAQKLDSLGGKILRINSDGSFPNDNPFSGSAVWSYGHRNPQGIAWHPVTGELYETEHGPSVFDGPAGGDEVNHISKGGNFGWPLVSHEKKRDGTISPLLVFTPAEAPGSAMFYNSDVLPQFKNNFFFGSLKGEGLMRVVFDSADSNKVASFEKLLEVKFGRIREVAQGPDGYIYFSTSNRDGRGKPANTDDRIFRILPK
jgi:glucose/arabinose dehydrogenase